MTNETFCTTTINKIAAGAKIGDKLATHFSPGTVLTVYRDGNAINQYVVLEVKRFEEKGIVNNVVRCHDVTEVHSPKSYYSLFEIANDAGWFNDKRERAGLPTREYTYSLGAELREVEPVPFCDYPTCLCIKA